MHRVTLQPSGLQFDVESGESVLAAALRQGYVLPYGCRNGACGSCKGKLLEGSVDYGVYQKRVFTDEENAQLEAVPVITGAAYEGGERPSIRGLVVDEAAPGTCPPGGR